MGSASGGDEMECDGTGRRRKLQTVEEERRRGGGATRSSGGVARGRICRGERSSRRNTRWKVVRRTRRGGDAAIEGQMRRGTSGAAGRTSTRRAAGLLLLSRFTNYRSDPIEISLAYGNFDSRRPSTHHTHTHVSKSPLPDVCRTSVTRIHDILHPTVHRPAHACGEGTRAACSRSPWACLRPARLTGLVE